MAGISKRLPWRPTEHAPAQNVQVDMVNRLARSRVHVEHGAVAFLMDIGLHRQFLGNLKHFANERIIFGRQLIQGWNVLLRSDQKVHRRLRPKVLECHDEVILMYKFRRCIVSDNSAKEARLLHGFNLALLEGNLN